MKSLFATSLLTASALATHTSAKLGMPVLAAPQWAAGLIYGLVGSNNLLEIEACAKDGHSMIP
jgi:hypothetical protein